MPSLSFLIYLNYISLNHAYIKIKLQFLTIMVYILFISVNDSFFIFIIKANSLKGVNKKMMHTIPYQA